MKYADFDYTKYPVVQIKMNPVVPNIALQRAFFDDFEKMFSMPDKAIVVFDSKDQKLIGSEARIQAGEWVKQAEIQKAMNEKIHCIIFTRSSFWLSMVLKAIFMIAKPRVPLYILKDSDSKRLLVKTHFDIKY